MSVAAARTDRGESEGGKETLACDTNMRSTFGHIKVEIILRVLLINFDDSLLSRSRWNTLVPFLNPASEHHV